MRARLSAKTSRGGNWAPVLIRDMGVGVGGCWRGRGRGTAARTLGVAAVNHRHGVVGQADAFVVEELGAQTLELGVGHLPPLVRVDADPVEVIHHQELPARDRDALGEDEKAGVDTYMYIKGCHR